MFSLQLTNAKIYFTPRRKPGRPPKTSRDIAAHIALRWARSGRPLPGVDLTRIRSPMSAVVRLWESRHYIGMGDPKDARAIVARGESYLIRYDALLFEDGPAEGARVLAVPNYAVRAPSPGAYVEQVVDCMGWCWTFGDEKAVLGDVRYPAD